MSFVISSALPFPNIIWWCKVMGADAVCWDASEHYGKMSYRNRYCIAGGNGLLKMSIPVAGGREQRTVMDEVRISESGDWRKQHWRTIVSAYSRAPYFEFYAASLEAMFSKRTDRLLDFNLATVHWLKEQVGLSFEERIASSFHKQYPDAVSDLRTMKPGLEACTSCDFPVYHQVFQDRTGFLPGLSLLDLLFAEGPFTLRWLEENKDAVILWSGNMT